MTLLWLDWDEIMRWQPDSEYIPSNYEAVGCILLTCAACRYADAYYVGRA